MLAKSDTFRETQGLGECSLTEDALGGWTDPDPEKVQPLGSDVDSEVEETRVVGVGTQGQMLGVTKLDVSRCVPLQGIGMFSTVEVTGGAATVD